MTFIEVLGSALSLFPATSVTQLEPTPPKHIQPAPRNLNAQRYFNFLEREIEKNPRNARAHYVLGFLHHSFGHYQRAAVYFHNVTIIQGNNRLGHIGMILAYMRYDKSLARIATRQFSGSGLDPKTASTLEGMLFLNEGKEVEAIGAFIQGGVNGYIQLALHYFNKSESHPSPYLDLAENILDTASETKEDTGLEYMIFIHNYAGQPVYCAYSIPRDVVDAYSFKLEMRKRHKQDNRITRSDVQEFRKVFPVPHATIPYSNLCSMFLDLPSVILVVPAMEFKDEVVPIGM